MHGSERLLGTAREEGARRPAFAQMEGCQSMPCSHTLHSALRLRQNPSAPCTPHLAGSAASSLTPCSLRWPSTARPSPDSTCGKHRDPRHGTPSSPSIRLLLLPAATPRPTRVLRPPPRRLSTPLLTRPLPTPARPPAHRTHPSPHRYCDKLTDASISDVAKHCTALTYLNLR